MKKSQLAQQNSMPSPDDLILPKETLSSIMEQADTAEYVMEQFRGVLLAPEGHKQPPVFIATQLANMCEIDRNAVNYRLTKGDLPKGQTNASGNRREFTLEETITWVREYRSKSLRPEGADAFVLAVTNFKGGVGKTTTTMTLAQGLSLRGHRVLVIDCDPQGSLTTLFGILPATEIQEEDTILPVCTGEATSLLSAIRPTYWHGIDIVGAAPIVYAAEFVLPAKQKDSENFEFWNVLNLALDEARQEYDIILIDTAPSLSFVTLNAIMSADGLLMPLPPNALAAASATQFWKLFTDIAADLVERRSVTKEFSFVRVLQTQVKSRGNDEVVLAVKDWIKKTYGSKVMSAEIHETKAAETTAVSFGTVYDDAAKSMMDPRTYKRAFSDYEQATEEIEALIRAAWRSGV